MNPLKRKKLHRLSLANKNNTVKVVEQVSKPVEKPVEPVLVVEPTIEPVLELKETKEELVYNIETSKKEKKKKQVNQD